MSDIKQKAIEHLEANLLDGDKVTDCGKTQVVIDTDFVEVFNECLDLAIAEERKRVVEMIKEYAEPYENSKWLNEVNAQKIIDLITNNNETF